MDLNHYLAILRRRKWVILVAMIVTIAVTLIVTLLTKPWYEASATLRIETLSGGASQYVGYNDIMYADRLMNTYTKIATADSTMKELAQRLGVQKAPQVVAEIPANTELISLKVGDTNPALAATAANALADILVADFKNQYADGGQTAQGILNQQLAAVKNDLDQAWKNYETLVAKSPQNADQIATAKRSVELEQDQYAKLLDQYDQTRIADTLRAGTISILQEATVPKDPSKPNKGLNLALGLLIGLAAGVGLAFLFENLDTRLYTTEQITEATGLAAIGKIPSESGVDGPRAKRESGIELSPGAPTNNHRPPVAVFSSGSVQGEAFRRLRTNLFPVDSDPPLRTLMVTSAKPGEGKSTIAANLAMTLAQSGQQVMLVDCNLGAPALHTLFGLRNDLGLTSVLRNGITFENAVQSSGIERLLVLTSGPQQADPAELLGSCRMAALIRVLGQYSEVVILDAPALLATTDTDALAQAVDGVLLVVGRAQVSQEAVRASREKLANLGARLVGVVVNRAEQETLYHYHQESGNQKAAGSRQ
ncbi:MAG: polysaccharide biosynthesis tyrosine autokinase [Chloroflexia bacterium]